MFSKQLASIVHILLLETDNCRKGENDRRKYFMICLHERMLLTGSNPQPPDIQSDAHPTEPLRPASQESNVWT